MGELEGVVLTCSLQLVAFHYIQSMLLLLASGIGICVFTLIQLAQQNQRMGQARVLAMAIQVLWILRFGLFYAKMVDLEAVTPVMFMYDQTLLFLDGPLIWLYTRSLTEKQKFWR